MKNINPSRMQGTKMIGTLASREIEKIASQRKFYIRRKGKITASILLESFITMMQTGQSSYWQWAVTISSVTGILISKQAVFKRMSGAWIDTVKALVSKVIAQQSDV